MRTDRAALRAAAGEPYVGHTTMTGTTTHDHGAAPVRAARRTVLRAAAWATPVVLVASAAPAFAASPVVFPLVITATNSGGGGSNKVVLTFTGGTGTLTITLVQRNGTTITVSPTTGVGAAGGTSTGAGQTYTLGATYTVTYTYQSQSYTQPVIGT